MKIIRAMEPSILIVLTTAGLVAFQNHPPAVAGAPETGAAKLKQELGGGKKVLVVDVRTPQEYAAGHIPGAVNIPLDQVKAKIPALSVPKGETIVTVCDRGGRSSRAAKELQKMGYKASSFCKLEAWRREGYKIETGKGPEE